MIDSGGINGVNASDLIKNLNKNRTQRKPEENKKTESLFNSENLEKSAEIKKILKKAESIPETREALVSHFREMIQNGAYDVDESAIVKKILG